MIEDFGVGSFARHVRELESLRGTVQACDSGIAGRSRTEAMHDYFEVAALRRQVALSNPLVDFDQLLFAGRGNYFGDDPTGQHQLSGPIAFCNRVGGGLYILQDFKTNAQVIDLIEHSVVENGSYKGWKLSGKGRSIHRSCRSTGEPSYSHGAKIVSAASEPAGDLAKLGRSTSGHRRTFGTFLK